MRYTFQLVLGDWSNDGHGRAYTRIFRANAPIEKVREAFFLAQARLPDVLDPTNMCAEYEESSISEACTKELKKRRAPRPSKDKGCTLDWLARYTAWFINQGDASLDVRLVKKEAYPTLHFYGTDARGRHLGFIGYGLF